MPIIEPEVLQDGTHTIQECAAVSEKVFREVMKTIQEYDLLIEGMMLKPNMVTPGASNPDKGDPKQPGSSEAHQASLDIAQMTLQTL